MFIDLLCHLFITLALKSLLYTYNKHLYIDLFIEHLQILILASFKGLPHGHRHVHYHLFALRGHQEKEPGCELGIVGTVANLPVGPEVRPIVGKS